MPAWAPTKCKRCGKDLTIRTSGRPRQTCSDACRKAISRVTKVNRTALSKSTHPTTQADDVSLSLPASLPATQEGSE